MVQERKAYEDKMNQEIKKIHQKKETLINEIS